MGDSIVAKSRVCLHKIHSLTSSHIGSVDEDWLELQSMRFNLWTSRLGVFASQRFSIVQRLRKNSTVANAIEQILDGIIASLCSVAKVDHGEAELGMSLCEPMPTQSIDDDFKDGQDDWIAALSEDNISLSSKSSTSSRDETVPLELETLKTTVNEHISTLLRFASLIRQQSTSRTLQGGDDYEPSTGGSDSSDSSDDDSGDHRRRSTDRKRSERFLAHAEHVLTRELGPTRANDATMQELKLLLLRSMEIRWRRICYRKARGVKFAHTTNHLPVLPQSSAPRKRKREHIDVDGRGVSGIPSAETPIRAKRLRSDYGGATTLPSEFDIRTPGPVKSNTQKSESRVGGNDHSLPTVPEHVRLSDSHIQYDCPYCGVLPITTKLLNPTSWRYHLWRDLSPYVCLYSDCDASKNGFTSVHAWHTHMNENHWKSSLVCPRCTINSVSYETENDFRHHMTEAHDGELSTQELSLITKYSRQEYRLESCPLCGLEQGILPRGMDVQPLQSSKRQVNIQNCIAAHLEALALSSLPWHIGHRMEAHSNTAQGSEHLSNASSGRSHLASNTAYASDFTHIGSLHDLKNNSAAQASKLTYADVMNDWTVQLTIAEPPIEVESEPDVRIDTSTSKSTPVRPSSYWSVPEQTDFLKYLAYFGTDFKAMADHMGTKTQTMLKNHFQRQKDGGKEDLEGVAKRADARRQRGEDIGPPPEPSAIIKRRYSPDSTSVDHESQLTETERTAMGEQLLSQQLQYTHQEQQTQQQQPQPPVFSDATTYVGHVKVKFADQPGVYKQFLEILKDFQSGAIDIPAVIGRIARLFRSQPELIEAFNTFLPPGYKIECATGKYSTHIRATTPHGSILNFAPSLKRSALAEILHEGLEGQPVTKVEPEIDSSPAVPVDPLPGGRRLHKYNSEFELEQILKQAEMEARIEEKAASVNTPSTSRRSANQQHKRSINKYGFTKLAEACEEGDLDSVKEWLEKDPEQLEIAEYARNKPIQIAALNGHLDIVHYLIESGCIVDCMNVDHDTPLIDATENGHLDVVNRLLQTNTDPRRRNRKGQQAWDLITEDTEHADEIRFVLRKAIEKWNMKDVNTENLEGSGQQFGHVEKRRRQIASRSSDTSQRRERKKAVEGTTGKKKRASSYGEAEAKLPRLVEDDYDEGFRSHPIERSDRVRMSSESPTPHPTPRREAHAMPCMSATTSAPEARTAT